MSDRLKPLIHEIHRRSLWQVLGVYVVASWAVLSVVDTLGGALNLPDWFPSLALALLVIGLPIVLATAVVNEGVSVGQADEVEPTPRGAPAAYKLLTWRNALGGGVLAFAVWGVVAAGWVLLGGRGVASDPTDLVASARPSIAVLQFETLGGSEDDEAFADGMHDELLHRLAQIGGLRVTSRTSVIGIRDQIGLSRDIAAALGVQHLVEGTFQRAGEQIRLIVQLIDPETDDHLWSETFTRTLTIENLFAMQSEIASAIARELATELTPQEQGLLADRPTEVLEAYEAYQRGKAYWSNRLVSREAAIREFGLATDADPRFVDAHALTARAQFLDFWFSLDSASVRPGLASLEEAMALDSTRASVHLARGDFLYYTQRAYDEAIAHYLRALELEPGNMDALATIGLMRRRQGRWDESQAYLLQAIELDPRSVYHLYQLALLEQWRRRPAEAMRWVDRALAIDPGNDTYRQVKITVTRCLLGDFDEARRLADESDWNDPSARERALSLAAVYDGDIDGADGYGLDELNSAFLRGRSDAVRRIAEARLDAMPDAARQPRFDLSGPWLPQDPGRVPGAIAFLEAAAGNDVEALRLANIAVGALAYEEDALAHVRSRLQRLSVYLTLGDTERVLDELEFQLSVPSAQTVACVERHPTYEFLRSNPRFEQILANASVN